MPTTARLGLIGLVVRDLGATLEFYRRLGLDLPTDAAHEPHVEVALPGGLLLAFDPVSTITSFDPSWQAPSGSPRVSLAFCLDTPEQVDELHNEMVEAGYPSHLAPFDAAWGQRYATIHDPDGNGVDLFAPIPTT